MQLNTATTCNVDAEERHAEESGKKRKRTKKAGGKGRMEGEGGPAANGTPSQHRNPTPKLSAGLVEGGKEGRKQVVKEGREKSARQNAAEEAARKQGSARGATPSASKPVGTTPSGN